MKVALIGDVHANLPALEAVLADARALGIEAIWNAGDAVGYGAFPEPTVRLLRDVCGCSVLGNYDRKVLRFPRKRDKWQKRKAPAKFLAFQWAHEHLSPDSREYLRSLPQELRFAVGRCRVLLTHSGSASAAEHLGPETPAGRLAELARQADADAVLCGHSHQPFAREVDGVWFVNAGSVGRPEGGDPRACYAVLAFPDGGLEAEHRRVAYDVERAAAAIRQNGLPEAFAQMVLRGENLEGVLAAPTGTSGRPPTPGERRDALAAAAALAEQCHYDQEHTEQVTRLALRLFDELRDLHGLGPAERHWLHCAALLHDIGWMEGRRAHHKTALRVILTSEALPFDRRTRHVVGSIARYHRRALPQEAHRHFAALAPRDREAVCKLAAILRVADGLDRTHFDVVADVRCDADDETVRVRGFVRGPAAAEIMAAAKKGDLFERTFARRVVFETRPASARGGRGEAGGGRSRAGGGYPAAAPARDRTWPWHAKRHTAQAAPSPWRSRTSAPTPSAWWSPRCCPTGAPRCSSGSGGPSASGRIPS
jgi:putative phosphoesterase